MAGPLKRNIAQLSPALVLLALVAAFAPGCALLKPSPQAGGAEPSGSPPAAAASGASSAAAAAAGASGAAAPVAATVPGTDMATVDRSDLTALKRVVIRLSYADVTLSTGERAKHGKLKITRLAGDNNCRFHLIENDGVLEITEPQGPNTMAMSAVSKVRSAVPVVGGCRYNVELGLHEAADTSIEVRRGELSAEGWEAPLTLKLEWGDVDFGSVGPLALTCGHCTVSGEGVAGALTYKIDSGNVGVAGLTGSVTGETLGDTVLKWRRLHADSKIHVVSHAGDVMLFFPDSPLSIDLNAPRGEVNSRLHSGAHGIPVSVTAELGNVQVYRAGGGAR